MKKKLRLAFDELEKEMEVIDREIMHTFKGGDGIEILSDGRRSYTISGGTLIEENGGVTFYGNDSSVCKFPGVSFSDTAASNTAWQFNGTIGIDPNWAKTSFNVYDFAHEYGHYIQQQVLPFNIYTGIAIYSMLDVFFNSDGHSETPIEKDATQLGEAFLNRNIQGN